jgi:hypothetical protein
MLNAIDEPPSAVLRPMLLTLLAGQQTRAAHLDDAIGTLARAKPPQPPPIWPWSKSTG